MAKQYQKDQSPNEWKAEVENQLKPTTIYMVQQNYSGDRLKVVQQIRVHLAHSGFIVATPIQVQKAAPAKLLIGRDFLSFYSEYSRW